MVVKRALWISHNKVDGKGRGMVIIERNGAQCVLGPRGSGGRPLIGEMRSQSGLSLAGAAQNYPQNFVRSSSHFGNGYKIVLQMTWFGIAESAPKTGAPTELMPSRRCKKTRIRTVRNNRDMGHPVQKL